MPLRRLLPLAAASLLAACGADATSPPLRADAPAGFDSGYIGSGNRCDTVAAAVSCSRSNDGIGMIGGGASVWGAAGNVTRAIVEP